jgi:hypothetical protein
MKRFIKPSFCPWLILQSNSFLRNRYPYIVHIGSPDLAMRGRDYHGNS